MPMTRLFCIVSALLVAGCDGSRTQVLAGTDGGVTDPNGSAPEALQPLPEPKLSAQLLLDPGPGIGSQAYLCMATPIEHASTAQIETVKWFPPRAGVVLHHVSLYAARGPIASGPLPCDQLPDLVATLGIYTPGNEPLTFPPGVTVQFPEQTSHLYFVAHVIRVDDTATDLTRVELGLAATPAPHAAQWVDVFADVPTIPAHETRSSTGSCLFLNDAHAVTVWAHMHRHGRRFTGTLVRADGTRETLVEIPSWDFNHQPLYPLDVQIHAGDSVETRCDWDNTSDHEVVPGSFTENEMCNQGLFVWPPEGTHCVPSL
jgi:hypothetical protein